MIRFSVSYLDRGVFFSFPPICNTGIWWDPRLAVLKGEWFRSRRCVSVCTHVFVDVWVDGLVWLWCGVVRYTFVCVIWLILMCDMTCLFMWNASFICVTWLMHMRDVTHAHVRHDSFICATWLIRMCDMTHSYVRHDHPYVWRDACTCATWLIYIGDMTHSYVWHDPFICATWLSTYVTCQIIRATWLINLHRKMISK